MSPLPKTYKPVVDCGQTLVSYTSERQALRERVVVDCGQTLVSYTYQAVKANAHQLWIADRPW